MIHPKIGGVGNADRIWASTPQNPASKEGVLCFLKCPRIFGLYYIFLSFGQFSDIALRMKIKK